MLLFWPKMNWLLMSMPPFPQPLYLFYFRRSNASMTSWIPVAGTFLSLTYRHWFSRWLKRHYRQTSFNSMKHLILAELSNLINYLVFSRTKKSIFQKHDHNDLRSAAGHFRQRVGRQSLSSRGALSLLSTTRRTKKRNKEAEGGWIILRMRSGMKTDSGFFY